MAQPPQYLVGSRTSYRLKWNEIWLLDSWTLVLLLSACHLYTVYPMGIVLPCYCVRRAMQLSIYSEISTEIYIHSTSEKESLWAQGWKRKDWANNSTYDNKGFLLMMTHN